MATFADMAQDNPNIREQYDTWRRARENNGENAAQWSVFRQHVIELGASDPGDTAPDDWVGDDYKASHPDWATA